MARDLDVEIGLDHVLVVPPRRAGHAAIRLDVDSIAVLVDVERYPVKNRSRAVPEGVDRHFGAIRSSNRDPPGKALQPQGAAGLEADRSRDAFGFVEGGL